jgi:hypothetical protein
MNILTLRAAGAGLCLSFLASGTAAQQAPVSSANSSQVLVDGILIAGPPPPVAPATLSRDAEGRTTIRAVRVTEPLRLDGRLDESLYESALPMTDFIQMEPSPGAPATEKTDVWIAFDQQNLYITVRCWDSQPESRWVLDEMRRDSFNIPSNENVAFYFDTFFDRRSAFLFEVTPLGAIYDAQAGNLRPGGADWNPVWSQATGRFDGGWNVEMAIPFKSIRYKPGSTQIWGFNIRRTVRWKFEESYLTRLPLIAGFSGAAAIFQIANGATLVGLEVPSGSKNLEIKPYAVASITTDRNGEPPRNGDADGDVGLDVKYGLTQNLTADFTYNTDFAQVEVDTQQVNLKRFGLFFPGKREFFLEGQSIFYFGGGSSGGQGAGGTTPLLFFSRRIGLIQGRAVPIQAGGRLTGRAGAFTIGVIDVRTDRDDATGTPATNFATIRLKRDLFERSSVGLLFTDRSISSTGQGASRSYGVDGAFNLLDFININAYAAKTDTPGLTDTDTSYRLQASYNLDRYGLQFERLAVGDNFRPDIGFVQRDDFHKTYALARFSPRPLAGRVRQYTFEGSYDRFTDGGGLLESESTVGRFSTELQNSDEITVEYRKEFERLAQPFGIARGVVIPIGDYSFQTAQMQLEFDNQRKISGTVSLERGSFYSGDKTTLRVSGARAVFSPRVSLEPAVSMNWIDLLEGSFVTTLVSGRGTFTVTPRMFVSGIIQYASAARTVGSNLRFRWEYQPGSELFLVYTDELDTMEPGRPTLKNRAFVVKINRLFRF